jgi:hypothetical protein
MGLRADELRARIGEAARKLTEARLVGDHFGAEAYRERLRYLLCIAIRHGAGGIRRACGPRRCRRGPAVRMPLRPGRGRMRSMPRGR